MGKTERKHRKLIGQLTLEEKAALLGGKGEWDSRDIPRLGIPSMIMSDGPHGLRRQAGTGDHLGLNASLPATCFPTAATMANSWDRNLCTEAGRALGEEAMAMGVNILLGPGMNIKRNPLCGRNFEYFSEDPYLAGKMAASYVNGIQSTGVCSCIKHFAVNSQEERRMAMNAVVDERTLHEIRLVIRLFGLSFIIALVNYFLDEYTSLPILGCYAVKYITATGIVMLFGFIAGWFYKSNFWMAFIYVGIVLVLAYFVDVIKTKKDIEFINSRIRNKK